MCRSRTLACRCLRHALKPRSEKRQGTKSREVERDGATRYGVLKRIQVVVEYVLFRQMRVIGAVGAGFWRFTELVMSI